MKAKRREPLLRPYEAMPGVQKDESEAQRTPFASL